MNKPDRPAPESEADLENMRRANGEKRAHDTETPVGRGDSRDGVLAEEDDPHDENPPASGS